MIRYIIWLWGTEDTLIFQLSENFLLRHSESIIKLFFLRFESLLGIAAVIILSTFSWPFFLLGSSLGSLLYFFWFLICFLILWEVARSVILSDYDGCFLCYSLSVFFYSDNPMYFCSYFTHVLWMSLDKPFMN